MEGAVVLVGLDDGVVAVVADQEVGAVVVGDAAEEGRQPAWLWCSRCASMVSRRLAMRARDAEPALAAGELAQQLGALDHAVALGAVVA